MPSKAMIVEKLKSVLNTRVQDFFVVLRPENEHLQ